MPNGYGNAFGHNAGFGNGAQSGLSEEDDAHRAAMLRKALKWALLPPGAAGTFPGGPPPANILSAVGGTLPPVLLEAAAAGAANGAGAGGSLGAGGVPANAVPSLGSGGAANGLDPETLGMIANAAPQAGGVPGAGGGIGGHANAAAPGIERASDGPEDPFAEYFRSPRRVDPRLPEPSNDPNRYHRNMPMRFSPSKNKGIEFLGKGFVKVIISVNQPFDPVGNRGKGLAPVSGTVLVKWEPLNRSLRDRSTLTRRGSARTPLRGSKKFPYLPTKMTWTPPPISLTDIDGPYRIRVTVIDSAGDFMVDVGVNSNVANGKYKFL